MGAVPDGSRRFQMVPDGSRGCLSLWFNQAVVFGEGYLLVSEYVNSFKLPAWLSESYPFKVRWDLGLSLKPVRGYVVSWSEDMVKNGAGQGVAAYWMLVELETDVSACFRTSLRRRDYESVLIEKRVLVGDAMYLKRVNVKKKGVLE